MARAKIAHTDPTSQTTYYHLYVENCAGLSLNHGALAVEAARLESSRLCLIPLSPGVVVERLGQAPYAMGLARCQITVTEANFGMKPQEWYNGERSLTIRYQSERGVGRIPTDPSSAIAAISGVGCRYCIDGWSRLDREVASQTSLSYAAYLFCTSMLLQASSVASGNSCVFSSCARSHTLWRTVIASSMPFTGRLASTPV